MNYTFKLSRRLATAWVTTAVAGAIISACTQDLQENSDPTAEIADPSTADLIAPPKRVVAEIGQTISLSKRAGGWQVRAVSDLPASSAVLWTASGGNITASGDFSAAKAGDYTVVAKRRGRKKADTTVVVVVPTPSDPVAITLMPDTTTLPAGSGQTFQAKAVLGDSSQTSIGVTWKATGGTIDAGGNYIAGPVPGHYVAIAKSVSYNLEDSALIVIDSVPSTPPPATPTLSSVRLSPDSVALFAGASQQFTAIGVLSDASTAPVKVTFSATGGTIDSSGLYRAGSTAGLFRVIATTGPFSDTSRVAISVAQTGTTIYPGQSIQAAVDAFPAGTSFLLKAGVHRQQSVVPKAGDSFVGETGTILSGAALIQPVRDGSYWVVSGQTQRNTDYNPNYNCQAGHDGCFYPEQLWVGTTLYEHVTSLGTLGPQKWYFDYSAHKIYLTDDPSGKVVETSITPTAFGGSASNVTIRNLVVQRYANAAQKGAIAGGRSWVVENVEVRSNHGTGIVVSAGSTIRQCYVHDQGQLGIKVLGNAAPTLVEDNEIAYNNVAFFGPGPYGEAGGTKFVGTDGLVVRGNFSHHNHGPGLWTDINNIRTTYENNRVEDNDWRGIFHEISYDAVIRNNVVRRNGFHFPGTVGAFEGAGILVSNSPNVQVYGNTVEDNRNGIMGREDARGSGSYGPYDVNNLWVHDNIVRQTDGGRAAGVTNSDAAANPYSAAANNHWSRNTYIVGSTTKWRWQGNVDLILSEWKAAGQDSGSAFQ